MDDISVLNTQEELVSVAKYVQLNGPYTTAAHEARKMDRVLPSVAEIFERQVKLIDGPGDVRDFWTSGVFPTRDAIYRHHNGDAKLVLDDPFLRDVLPGAPTYNGVGMIGGEEWSALEGDTVLFIPGDRFETFPTDGTYSPKRILESDEWKFVMRDNTELRDEYLERIISMPARGEMHFCFPEAPLAVPATASPLRVAGTKGLSYHGNIRTNLAGTFIGVDKSVARVA